MKRINKSSFYRKVALLMVALISYQGAFPTRLLGLTAGPAQPEFSSFEPIGTTQMVDLFSGNFVYNIPLFELPGPDGGYPFNLAYHSGITMDQEASWVGLGWTLNQGAINRVVRGLPDDFNGENIERRMDMKDNKTWNFGLNIHNEFWGYDPNPENSNFASLGLGLGLNIMHNNYIGWGLGLDAGVNSSLNDSKSPTANIGLGLDINSFEGASLKPTLSFGFGKEKLRTFSLSGSINSREGMQVLTLGYSTTKKDESLSTNSESIFNSRDRIDKHSIPYTFGVPSYTPQVSMPYRGTNFSSSFEVGGFGGWLASGVSLDVNLNRQTLENKNEWVSAPAYGYFHLKERGTSGDNSLMDFNREKDGPIREVNPNLASPITTPDIYSVQGQGTGGSYRPYRSDIGILSDAYENSETGGKVFGVEFNVPGIVDLGVDIGGNWANSSTEKWESNLGELDKFNFIDKSNTAHYNSNPDFENYYFKAAGELTAEPIGTYEVIGNENAVALKLEERVGGLFNEKHLDYDDNTTLIGNGGYSRTITSNDKVERDTRKPRANHIQPLTNAEITYDNGGISEEALGEFRVKYYSDTEINNYTQAPTNSVTRNYCSTCSDKDQLAVMSSLQPNGMRYVYGLPVKNHTQEEIVFSVSPQSASYCGSTIPLGNIPAGQEVDHNVPNTDEYVNHTKMPAYNNTFLLTSVLGADYVDADNIKGPSDGDYGYWVKFNYVLTNTNYQWKAPYNDANFIKGNRSVGSDDKAAIMYGSRDQFYLATAETRTHIAEFSISERRDGFGVSGKYHTTSSTVAGESYKLDKISLFSKLERYPNGVFDPNAEPIKIINLKYDYSLCGNTLNNDGGTTFDPQGNNLNINKGKLTLKEVNFTYESSTRGMLSPYQFIYPSPGTAGNPDYSLNKYDRWGSYKPDGTECERYNYPYAEQDHSKADLNATAWHLEKIILPSGSQIEVDYESDDYAYVQDRTAMQMFEIDGIGSQGNFTIVDPEITTNDDELKIYFKKEAGYTGPIEDYLSDIHGVTKNPDGTLSLNNSQVYYKILSDLNNQGDEEYVSGYAKIIDYYSGGDVNADYWIKLDVSTIGKKNKKNDYHPFAAAAWQKLKLEFPNKINGESLDDYDENSLGDAVGKFLSAFDEIADFFKDFYSKCAENNFGTKIVGGDSFIRLNSPDKIKKGGGVRVKQITLIDNWDILNDIPTDPSLPPESTPTYGQVFEYTMPDPDDNSRLISSGVAINEPSIGYEECALRFAKIWTSEATLKSVENLIFEYPINESYYPGPSVGYSKVTVKSLATEMSLDSGSLPNDVPQGFASTGVTVNEFYTAKDFPVLVEETELDARVSPKKFIPLGIGSYRNDKYTGSQGYAIILNDMHGKPFKVTHYGQDKGGNVLAQKTSEVVYTYKTDNSKVYNSASDKKIAQVLNNEVEVLLGESNTATSADVQTQSMGVDIDFFMDMRESVSNSGSAYYAPNFDASCPLCFVFTTWPRLSFNDSRTRTVVTNKIIRKSGILIQTDAYDGQSHITTSNKVFDPLTGEPLLTTVNNQFDDLVYNYNVPARLAYDGMGEAYQNWGIKFTGELSNNVDCEDGNVEIENILPTTITNFLKKGDELILTYQWITGNMEFEKTRAIFQGLTPNGNYSFYVDFLPKDVTGDFEFIITRSIFRNYLNTMAGNITALNDPTINRIIPAAGENCDNIDITYPIGSSSTNTHSVNIPINTIDNVVNASAITYKDAWDLEQLDCDGELLEESHYAAGRKGIWRVHENYVFIDERLPNSKLNATEVNIKSDGIYNAMPLFNWKDPFWEYCDNMHGWKKTNEITKYAANGEETENRDILGNYSTALYGYKNNVPTAVAANARYYEIAFESFEENLNNNTGSPEFANEAGHLNFDEESFQLERRSETYNIIGAYDGGLTIWIDKEYKSSEQLPDNISLYLTDSNGNTYEGSADVISTSNVSNTVVGLDLPFHEDITQISISNLSSCNLPINEKFRGRVMLKWSSCSSGKALNVIWYISSQFAHTGAYSLTTSNQDFSIPQRLTNLEVGKKYVLSAWVNRPSINAHTYNDGNLRLGVSSNGISTYFFPSGEIIEGWQRIEGIFTHQGGDWNLIFDVNNSVWEEAFFDDIRIYPLDGSLQTYVYDPADYRLKAVLDANNYATFYNYDEEGNLVLVKKETERGIKTIQESREYVRGH